MKCPNCQFNNLTDAKFCNECGEELELTCPKCQKFNPAGSKFCNECGEGLLMLKDSRIVDDDRPQTYTPKYIADNILSNRSYLEGEQKIVTVLFADVANYTSLSERLDPEEVHQLMDGCFKILMNDIHKFEGTINQFTGDGVMALFGAPLAHEDHAQRACHAALNIQQSIREYSKKIENVTGLEFKMRVGINSGPVVVGAIGDELRMDYTAFGDTTNLASRMESLASPGSILISDNTNKLARDYFEFSTLREINVKGKEQPQKVYELIKPSNIETLIEASIAKGLTSFVGRDNSMSRLCSALDVAKSRSGQVIGLVGEAGVGKSRLLLELRHKLFDDSHRYMEGRCLHYGKSMLYLPILDILKSFFNVKEGDTEFIVNNKVANSIIKLDVKLEWAIPFFKDILSINVDDVDFLKLDPREKREKTFEALHSLITRLSQEKPLIIAIEDLHWIDKTSEDFIHYLINSLAKSPILLILLYRPEYTHQWGNKSYYSKVGLTPLGKPSSNELIKAILEDGEIATELQHFIIDRSAGNPLFMEELTHALLESGSVEKSKEQYVLCRKVADIKIPVTIQGIISARIDRLEENLKRTMQVASVIGREFAFRILHTITEMKDNLKSHLHTLKGLELIYEKELFPELEYIFKHALTQEVAYNSILLKRRKEIHDKIAIAIENLYANRVEEFYEILAYHYSNSYNLEKAIIYYKLSGIKASQKYSRWEALQAFINAIKALNKLSDSPEIKKKKVEIRVLMAPTAFALGYPNDTGQILEEGIQLANEVGDQQSILTLRRTVGFYNLFKKRKIDRSLNYFRGQYDRLDEDEDLAQLASRTFDLGYLYGVTGQFSKICQICPPVITILESEKMETNFFGRDLPVYVSLCNVYGYSLAMTGKMNKGIKSCNKGFHVAKSVNEKYGLGNSLFMKGVIFIVKSDGQQALEYFEKAIKYFEEAGHRLWTGVAYIYLGEGYFYSGNMKKSKQSLTKGKRIIEELDMQILFSLIYQIKGMIHFEIDHKKQALKNTKKACDLAISNEERHIEALSLIHYGRILSKGLQYPIENAEKKINSGISIANELMLKPFSARGYMILGEHHKTYGTKEKGLKLLKKAEDLLQEMDIKYWLNKTKKLLAVD